MKRSQIKELAQSIVKYDSASDNDVNWIFSKFSRKDLKLFMRLLEGETRQNSVIVSHAGAVSAEYKDKIISLFPNKKISFKRSDEELGGGLKIEYSDFVWDYSVSGIVKRILNNIRESL
ncbi:MAG: hypothetical protein LBN20_02090 [Endomicrobium sp.]|jgi:F0F1-type ATP synthase delta subunit|nr:hypothetical protein [Endomicrobium sp.]